MIDVIARLLLSAGIMVGTAYLPSFPENGAASPEAREATAGAVSCPVGPVPEVGTPTSACHG